MEIVHLKVNHLVNPLGYDLGCPTISYVVRDTAAKKQEKAQVLVSLDEDFSAPFYDSGESKKSLIPPSLCPSTCSRRPAITGKSVCGQTTASLRKALLHGLKPPKTHIGRPTGSHPVLQKSCRWQSRKSCPSPNRSKAAGCI